MFAPDMKIELWSIGKTSDRYLQEGIQLFSKRINRHISFELIEWPDVKNASKLPPELLREQEGTMILAKLHSDDYLIALDEHGRKFRSLEFATQLQKMLMLPHRKMVFLIGGAYGLPEKIFRRSQLRMALSDMTFSHQLIRLIFAEQLYRAFSILNNEPYHNE